MSFFLIKCLKQKKKYRKKHLLFTISVFFHRKGFDCINLGSILHLHNIKYLFPDRLKIDESASVVYSLGKTIRNRILNYKETVSFIDTNEDITYDIGIGECDCQ